MANETMLDIHHLDEVGLITIWRFPWILPRQLPAIGKEHPGPVPTAESVACIPQASSEK
jgi:hypothetical protein